jgi:hypothetical protein
MAFDTYGGVKKKLLSQVSVFTLLTMFIERTVLIGKCYFALISGAFLREKWLPMIFFLFQGSSIKRQG